MRVSSKGICALAMHEGVVPAPYLDSRNVWTFGVGHTASAGEPDPAKMPRGTPGAAQQEAALREAFRVFAADLARFEARVRDAVAVPLAQHEFDALVSFDFNTGGIFTAQLTKSLNRGDRIGAGSGFMGWLKPPEIRGRREAEQRLFREGAYPSGSVPVYGVTASNKPGAIIRRLSMAEVLGYLEPPAAPALTLEARVDDIERRLRMAGL